MKPSVLAELPRTMARIRRLVRENPNDRELQRLLHSLLTSMSSDKVNEAAIMNALAQMEARLPGILPASGSPATPGVIGTPPRSGRRPPRHTPGASPHEVPIEFSASAGSEDTSAVIDRAAAYRSALEKELWTPTSAGRSAIPTTLHDAMAAVHSSGGERGGRSVEQLSREHAQLSASISELQTAHMTERALAGTRRQHELELASLRRRNEAQIAEVRQASLRELRQLENQHEQSLSALKRQYDAQLGQTTEAKREEQRRADGMAAELAELTAKMRAADGDGAKLAMLQHEYAKEMASLSRAHEDALRAAEAARRAATERAGAAGEEALEKLTGRTTAERAHLEATIVALQKQLTRADAEQRAAADGADVAALYERAEAAEAALAAETTRAREARAAAEAAAAAAGREEAARRQEIEALEERLRSSSEQLAESERAAEQARERASDVATSLAGAARGAAAASVAARAAAWRAAAAWRGVAARRVARGRPALFCITFCTVSVRIRPGGPTVSMACPEGVEVSLGMC